MTWNRSIRRAMLAGLAMLVAGCASTRGGQIPYDVADFGTPDAPKVAKADDMYKLAPLDTVTV
jgi:polysaccharide export outer membrane protein